MSSTPEENKVAKQPVLPDTLAGEAPPGQQNWDIPLDEGIFTSSRIPRPDPRNNPRTEMYARVLASIGTVFIAGAFVAWIFLADTEMLASLFFKGESTITNMGLLTLAGIAALGSIVLNLILHPLMRALVKSKIAPRTLDAPQRAILEMMPSPVFFLNTEARLEDVNSAFTKAVGRSANSIIGRSIYDFIPDEEQETAYQALVKVAAGELEELRCPIVTKRGVRIFNIQAEPYQGHNTDSHYIVGIGLDITETRAASDALESRYQVMHKATRQTLEMIAHAVEMRDPYLHGHHERVAKLCTALAHQLNLPTEQVISIELAARAHDVGTIRIPFEIQIKPGRLSEAETTIIEGHTLVGAEILSRVEFPGPVADIVLQHHEFVDGSGYPNGLKGAEILLGARVLAVADAYDALISQRPYRAAVTRVEALQRLMALSGKHYDPRVISALSTAVQKISPDAE